MRQFVWLWLLCASAWGAEKWDHPVRRLPPDVQHGVFRSASVRADVGYNICLPPAYATDAAKRFPVIYYLHGYKGHESSYLEYANYWREAVKSSPCILVFVNGGETSFFTDAPQGTPGETLVVTELIPHIDAKFRTIPSRDGRSLHGYSMGGFGALKLAMKFPEQFGSVVSYGATLADAADFKKHLGKVFAQQFGGDPQRYAANDPLTLAEKTSAGSSALRIVVGTRDEFLPQHRTLRDKLKKTGALLEYEEIPGAKHDKDDLYAESAARGFAFSLKHFKVR